MHLLIPTHNRPQKLRALLDSISAADHIELIDTVHIIENGSKVADEVARLYQERLPIKYIHLEEGNKSKALNTAIDHIPEDALLLFFDDDIKIDPNVLNRFKTISKQFGSGHFFSGGLRADYEEQPAKEVQAYLPRSARNYDIAKGKDYLVFENYFEFLGANFACYRSDLMAAGGFSPEFGPGSKSGARGQETDAQYRMAANGVKAVAIGNALVDHWVPRKFVQPEWIIERIYLSSIHLGKEKSSLLKTTGLMAKLAFSLLQYGLGNRSIGPRYRIAKAAGYLKGLISY